MNNTEYNNLTIEEKILVETQVSNRAKKACVAWVLWAVWGEFGAHRFYFGKTGSAIAMLILSLSIIGLIISIPWTIIDAFSIQKWIHETEEQIKSESIAQLTPTINVE